MHSREIKFLLEGAPYFILDFTEVRSCVAAALSVDKGFVILNTEL